MAVYNRIVLKLSGETLSGGSDSVIDRARAMDTARMLTALCAEGVQAGVVMGGGNIWRGGSADWMDQVSADQIGMLATIMNALAVREAIAQLGGKACVMTAQEMHRFAPLYTRDAALAHMEAGEIVLLAGGTGHPFFTTDTAAALRAAELKADALFKGTKVEGVMTADPFTDPTAALISDISYGEVIERKLNVMDIIAFQICQERGVPVIRVFAMDDLGNILKVARGDAMGSTVHP